MDLIHGHFLRTEGVAAVLLGKILNKPTIVTAHDSALLNYHRLPSLCKSEIRFTLKYADRIIFVSEAMRRKASAIKDSLERNKVIPNGIDTTVFKSLLQEKCRRRLGLPLNHKIVLFVGGWIRRKGIQLLIESIPVVLSKTSKPVLFLIVGKGELENQLRKRIKELQIENSVQFVGVKENTELPLWINSSNLLSLPTFYEPFGIIIIESLACGVPVVASNVGGIPEIIKDESLGILCPPGKPAALSSAIVRTLSKKWDRKKMREYVMKRYDWELISQKIMDVYCEIKPRTKSDLVRGKPRFRQ